MKIMKVLTIVKLMQNMKTISPVGLLKIVVLALHAPYSFDFSQLLAVGHAHPLKKYGAMVVNVKHAHPGVLLW